MRPQASSYEAAKAVYDVAEGFTSFFGGASKSLNGIINAGKITGKEKLTAITTLLDAVNKLYDKFEEGSSETIKLANDIQSSEVYDLIKNLSNEADCEAFLLAETAENILELADNIYSSVGDGETAGGAAAVKPYNAFDSLRTMITNLPIRYVVDSVTVETLERSTTVIPHEIVMVPVESPTMGVDNWGGYIYNLVISAMGKISAPWYAQILGAPDDITGYDDAVEYVRQVENQIAAYSVHKGSGARFESWIVPASQASGISTFSARSSEKFLLSTENETAQYVDGVLTFTGNGVIEVTALTQEGGTLYIKDEEGNVKTIVIDVVEQHTCHSDVWHTELAPTDEFDGYRAKYCDVCGNTIAAEVIRSCGEHIYGEWIIEQQPTEEIMGIRYRECVNCYARETEYLPIINPDLTVQQFMLNQDYIVMEKGETAVINAEVLPSEFAGDVVWSTESGSEDVISVAADGTITACGAGTDYVVATVSDGQTTLTASCRVDVSEPFVLEGIQLSTNAVTT